ncbi:rubrerythrin family protein [Desulfospira joergensenii]|uniref:rubrerythrin family protein n=1 Tax=Desulfospira joergensenii TaxID=53329 RepID=UPI0003B34334|nr:rubrerythrin family protein [Desulfospira joergensenii]
MARTVDNLTKMFLSNAESNIRYLAFAEAADQEGRQGVAKAFRALAMSKMVHAISHFKATGLVDTTAENLKQASEEEKYDYKSAYPAMVQDAVKEDAIQGRHSLEYGLSIAPVIIKLIAKAMNNPDMESEGSYYICPVCGNIEFKTPSEKCPFCGVDVSQFTEIS